MKKNVVVSLAALSLIALPAQAVSINALKSGEVAIAFEEGEGKRFIQVKGLLKVPVKQAWKHLIDFRNYPRIYESVTRTEIRSQSQNQAVVWVEMQLPWPINKLWVINRYTMNPKTKALTWQMLESSHPEHTGNGAWRLREFDDSTLATYQLQIKAGDGVKGWVQKKALTNSIPGIFRFLEQKMR